MAWWKQGITAGLSTIGEGLSTLTKEILAEDLEEHGKVNGSAGSGKESILNDETGSYSDASRTAGFEEKIKQAERIIAAKTAEQREIIDHYERNMTDLHDQIERLQGQLEFMSLQTSANRNEPVTSSSPQYVDVDLNASPTPFHPPINHGVVDGMESSTQTHDLSRDESTDSGLIDVLEAELAEKERTIRHLTQELFRIRSEIESQPTRIQEDAAVQSESWESLDSGSADSGLDVETQTHHDISLNQPEKDVQEVSCQHDELEFENPKEVQEAACQYDSDMTTGQISPDSTEEPRTQSPFPSSQDIGTDPHTFDDDNPQSQSLQPIVDHQESQTDFSSLFNHQESQATIMPTCDHQESQTTFTESADFDAQVSPVIHAVQSQTDLQEVVSQEIQTDAELLIPSISDQQPASAKPETVDMDSQTDASHNLAEFGEFSCQTDVTGNVYSQEDIGKIQHEVQIVYSEYASLKSTNERLNKELERLKNHLLTVEQGFAQDFESVQTKEQELQEQLEASRLRNLELESRLHLQIGEQAQLVSQLRDEKELYLQARDEAVIKLQEAERKNHQIETSLATLRQAVEHMKREQRSELEHEKDRWKKQVKTLEEELQSRAIKISSLESQLRDLEIQSRRVPDILFELQSVKGQMGSLTLEVEEKERQINKLTADSKAVTSGKVDKDLMKSIILGYFAGPKNAQHDVLRLMMNTLDLTDAEKEKVHMAHTSLLRSLFSGPARNASHVPDESFSKLLVQFVDNESRPKATSAMNGPPRTSPVNPSREASSRSRPNDFNHLYSQQNSEKQDRVLQKILDTPDASTKPPSSIDTV